MIAWCRCGHLRRDHGQEGGRCTAGSDHGGCLCQQFDPWSESDADDFLPTSAAELPESEPEPAKVEPPKPPEVCTGPFSDAYDCPVHDPRRVAKATEATEPRVLWEGNVSRHFPHRLLSNGKVEWRDTTMQWRPETANYVNAIAAAIAEALAAERAARAAQVEAAFYEGGAAGASDEWAGDCWLNSRARAALNEVAK